MTGSGAGSVMTGSGASSVMTERGASSVMTGSGTSCVMTGSGAGSVMTERGASMMTGSGESMMPGCGESVMTGTNTNVMTRTVLSVMTATDPDVMPGPGPSVMTATGQSTSPPVALYPSSSTNSAQTRTPPASDVAVLTIKPSVTHEDTINQPHSSRDLYGGVINNDSHTDLSECTVEDIPDMMDIDFTTEIETFHFIFAGNNQLPQDIFKTPADDYANNQADLLTPNTILIVRDIGEQDPSVISQIPSSMSVAPLSAGDNSLGLAVGVTNPLHTVASLPHESAFGSGMVEETGPGQGHSVASTTTFEVPYKRVRGHCGDQDCIGCNREPCGSCYNCLHKREKR